MKYVLGRTFIFCAALSLFSVAARADLITFTISQPITGNLVNGSTEPFSNKMVTYQAMFTTESLVACAIPDIGCINNTIGDRTEIFADENTGLTATWTIESIGTFVEAIPLLFFTFRGSPEHPQDIVIQSGGDVEGHGSLPDPFIPNYNSPPGEEPCADENPCPVRLTRPMEGPSSFSESTGRQVLRSRLRRRVQFLSRRHLLYYSAVPPRQA